MNENPYKSPLCGPDTIRGFSIRFTRLLRSPLGRFTVGCLALAPACWLLGRALIPPDDAAFRFSLAAWAAASIVWAGTVWINSPAR
ncbi:MAG: hypothetical protein WD278_13560 [Pirellulales bacterium]